MTDAFLATVAEQFSLVVADQIAEARLLAGLVVGMLDAALVRVRDRAIDACYDAGIIPRCARCSELVHEPEPIVAGRCPRCDGVVDGAADGQLDEPHAQLAESPRVRRGASPLDNSDNRGARCAPMFSHGGGI